MSLESELANASSLVLQRIDQDPSLESVREVYEQDLAKPELDIITVAGLKCVGVPIGTPESVNAFVRFKAHAIQQDVQKLRIVQDSSIDMYNNDVGQKSAINL